MTDLDSTDSVSVPNSHFLSVKGMKYWTSQGVTGRTKGCIAKRVTDSRQRPGNNSADSGDESRVSVSVTLIQPGILCVLFVQVSFHRKTMVSSFCLAFLGDS